ncbi:MAG: hypothetical protein ABS58_16745 [Mesorhizobium sp. SCN 65-20]|nr:MAG: hypothetical protein ABS58_16745 [Mesorhizobium sp. SCN 65-20]
MAQVRCIAVDIAVKGGNQASGSDAGNMRVGKAGLHTARGFIHFYQNCTLSRAQYVVIDQVAHGYLLCAGTIPLPPSGTSLTRQP